MRISVLLAIISCCLWSSAQALQLEDLRVNEQVTPSIPPSQVPHFSWRMESTQPGLTQESFSITVLGEDSEVVWDSGNIKSAQSHNIEFQGSKLDNSTRYRWRLEVTTNRGDIVKAASWFQTTLMESVGVWSGASWIGGSERDTVFRADYLSVFQISFNVQLDAASQSKRGAFLFGGNDFRLQQSHLNLAKLRSNKNQSFVAVELDISPLEQQRGNALMNIYRTGYTADDSRSRPLASIPIPSSLINFANRYQKHRITLNSLFGRINLFINGHSAANRITAHDPNLPPYIRQGLSLNPYNNGTPNPGDSIVFPMLGEIGFWMKPQQTALFSDIEIRHLRPPSNRLFSTNPAHALGNEDLFSADAAQRNISRQAGTYRVEADATEYILLADPSNDGAPLLRHQFDLTNKGVRKATLYATARGIYEAFINGKRVGEYVFTPGLTQYNIRQNYQTYDVTELINSGEENVIAAALGEGWWSGNITYDGEQWNFFGDRQSFLAKLIIQFKDGSTKEINTAPNTWKVSHHGPIRYSSMFQGEVYDATREASIIGWNEAGFDATKWEPAHEVDTKLSTYREPQERSAQEAPVNEYDQINLDAQLGSSPQIVRTLEATAVHQTAPNVFVYDMGQNMVGFPKIDLQNAEPGKPVILRYAEALYPQLPLYSGLAGTPMIENLRGALVHDIYFPKGGTEVIQPHFTFHGYRYLEITGLSEALPLSSVKGMVASSIEKISAHYESSNPLVNRLWENIVWSMRGNFLSIPTDTPARNERMGWNGDLNMFARTANYISPITPFIRRHLLANRDTQSASGRFPDVAPLGGGFGGVLWGSAGIFVPWQTYLHSGNPTIIEEHYPAMKRYIEYLQSRIDDPTQVLIEGPLGDWLSPETGRNDNSLLWEAYHIGALKIMQRSAGLLKFDADAKRFQALHSKRKAFFNKTYIDNETGKTIASGWQFGLGRPATYSAELRGQPIDTQASYAVALEMGAVADDLLSKVKEQLVNSISRTRADDLGIARPRYSLMTGFIGTASLLDALTSANQVGLAYSVLQHDEYPSWLYSVRQGSTTIWERLDSFTDVDGFGDNNSMNSFNHYAFGSVGQWMMAHSLGIQADPLEAGFKSFVLAPNPDPTKQMTWAKGHYNSRYGRIESSWARHANELEYTFRIPPNSLAVLKLPVPENAEVIAPNQMSPSHTGVRKHEYQLPPGTYSFRVLVDG